MVFSIWFVAIWIVVQTPSRFWVSRSLGSISKTSHQELHTTGRAAHRYSGRSRQSRADEKYCPNSVVRSCHRAVKSQSSPKSDIVSLQYSDRRRECARRICGYLPERTIAGVQKEHLERSGLAPHHQIFAVRIRSE